MDLEPRAVSPRRRRAGSVALGVGGLAAMAAGVVQVLGAERSVFGLGAVLGGLLAVYHGFKSLQLGAGVGTERDGQRR
jgi:hypothetical protein